MKFFKKIIAIFFKNNNNNTKKIIQDIHVMKLPEIVEGEDHSTSIKNMYDLMETDALDFESEVNPNDISNDEFEQLKAQLGV